MMKKFMIMAFVALLATTAVAQNPEALKQIKKEKSADAVKALLEANEASMSAAENAQAYNKLVDIYMKDVSAAVTAIQTNELARQMGQEPKDNVDMQAFYDELVEAYKYALKCDEYDCQADEKGKVAPKFRKANGERLYSLRGNLVNAGQEAQNNEDNVKAADIYTLYVVTGTSPLFADFVETAKKVSPTGVADEYLSEVARVASLTSFNNGDVDKAIALTDVMLADTDIEKVNEGLALKIYYLERGLNSREDSLRCLETYKELYAQYPQNEDVFSRLASMYGNLGQSEEENALIEKYIKDNPDGFMGWALKGQVEINDQKYDEAVADLKKALQCEIADDGQKAIINMWIGVCYSQKANQEEITEKFLDVLNEAMPYLEAARALDPEDHASWAYPLYNCYYHIKGENDPATEELRVMLGL